MTIDRTATTLKRIELEPICGSHIEDCLRDAIIQAVTSKCDVTFIHNVTKYTVYFATLINTFNSREASV